jgi:hypothetical protein
MKSNTKLDLLQNDFMKSINSKKIDKSQAILNKIIEFFPEQKQLINYYKIVIEYYDDKLKSLNSYDSLFLAKDSNFYSPEGYYFALKFPSNKKVELKARFGHPWTSLNPSIVKLGDHLLVNIRSSNYIIKGTTYIPFDENNHIKTRNKLLFLNPKNLNETKSIELKNRIKYFRRNDWGIKGFEDNRLFVHKNQLYVLSVTYDTHELSVPRLVHSKINLNAETIDDTIELIIKGLPREIPEKNWLPFSFNDRVYAVYSYHPFSILDITNPSNPFFSSSKCNSKYNFKSFRGSAPPIQYRNNHFLCVVHQVYSKPDNSRVYIHRFLEFNHSFEMTRISFQFYFIDFQIEFCSGMIENNDEILLTFGIKDLDAFLYSIDKKKIEEMMYVI